MGDPTKESKLALAPHFFDKSLVLPTKESKLALAPHFFEKFLDFFTLISDEQDVNNLFLPTWPSMCFINNKQRIIRHTYERALKIQIINYHDSGKRFGTKQSKATRQKEKQRQS
jgi:hypothetical protein